MTSTKFPPSSLWSRKTKDEQTALVDRQQTERDVLASLICWARPSPDKIRGISSLILIFRPLKKYRDSRGLD